MSFDDFLKERGRNNGTKAAAKAILDKVCFDAFGVGVHSVMLTPKETSCDEEDTAQAFDRLHKSFFDLADAYKKYRNK